MLPVYKSAYPSSIHLCVWLSDHRSTDKSFQRLSNRLTQLPFCSCASMAGCCSCSRVSCCDVWSCLHVYLWLFWQLFKSFMREEFKLAMKVHVTTCLYTCPTCRQKKVLFEVWDFFTERGLLRHPNWVLGHIMPELYQISAWVHQQPSARYLHPFH